MHIRATQVERPGNIVEGRHQHAVSMLLAQGSSDTGEFVVRGLSCIFHGEYLHGILRNNRTVCPYLFQWIQIRTKGDASLMTQLGNQFLYGIGRRTRAV